MRKKQRISKWLIGCLLGGFALNLVQMVFLFRTTHLSSIDHDCLLLQQQQQQQDSPVRDPAPPPSGTNTTDRTSIGWNIVMDAYQQTWGQIECHRNKSWKDCLEGARYNGGEDKDWPWWFQTMLRDAHASSKIHLKWHWLSFRNNLNFCSMEKIGTKQFRRLQCLVNYHVDDIVPRPGGSVCSWNGTRSVTSITAGRIKSGDDDDDDDAEDSHEDLTLIKPKKAVFLRDPLERFLSAFLDKCLDQFHRESEGHCEPAQIFVDEENGRLVYDILDDDPPKFFQAYVDTMPLKWNVHFFPQGMYCDGLARTIAEFDFVGHMTAGPQFYQDLYDFGQRFGGKNDDDELEGMMDKVFDISHRRNLPDNHPNKTTNTYTETSASTQVKKYYNAKTVRHVLEYLAIDYVALGLSIPQWAEEMLLEDQSG